MRVVIRSLACILMFLTLSCKQQNKEKELNKVPVEIETCHYRLDSKPVITRENGDFEAYETLAPIEIDGCSKDSIWSNLAWYDMNYLWMGTAIDSGDYKGRFKLSWDRRKLYILVEVADDYLNPTLADGTDDYWKGDYVEVFIDEDMSGGDHKFNHQAFAYHVSTEGHAIDKNTLEQTVFFDEHIEVKRTQEGNKHLWEMAIKLFDDQFDENATSNIPVGIIEQKKIGFSIAYGDNDGKSRRENFMGSKKTHGSNNDEGYINSDVFGSILFVK